MIKLDYLQLICGEPITVKGIGEFHSPTIREVSEIGEDTYNKYLSAIYSLKNAKDDEAICAIMDTEEFEDALGFFVKYNVNDIDYKSETLYEDTIESACDLILQLNYINQDVKPKAKFKNKRASDIMEKIENANLNPANTDKSQRISLGELISAICRSSVGYNYQNVLSLTICQVYDLFFGLHMIMNYDINAMHYAAWGGEDFDPTGWYKQKQEKGA